MEVRQEVIRVIADHCCQGPLASVSHFSCYSEYGVKDSDTDEAGRVDLVIEVDDAVIGIESRYLTDQYLEHLRRQIGFMSDCTTYYTHLRARWEPYGSSAQRLLVADLWRFFPQGGPRLSAGDT